MFSKYELIEYIASFIAVLLVISVHEFAHAFVAVKCGDDTPKVNGRYTLNPMSHLNLWGFLSMVLVGFGWANPVPINPYNFKNIKRGYFWTSIAGVLANFVFAFIAYPFAVLSLRFFAGVEFVQILLYLIFYQIFSLNLCFFVFNLIPVYPLDGFRVLEVSVKRQGKVVTFLREKGYYILLTLIVISFVTDYIPQLKFLDVLSWFMSFAVNIIGWPITAFWGLVF